MSKILIVDDDVIITDLLKALLTMEGHQPVTVNDSLEAINVADSVKPDLITLDLMMPGLTGFELCGLLHQDPRFVDIPIMIISARDDFGSREKALQAGAKAYLTKPFAVEELMQYISKLTGS